MLLHILFLYILYFMTLVTEFHDVLQLHLHFILMAQINNGEIIDFHMIKEKN